MGRTIPSSCRSHPAAQILEGGICDRLPVKSWSQGRITLLGDAAHAMAPALAQGANTTFEDAYELALCFSQASTIEEVLVNYEQRRIPRTQMIQTCSAFSESSYYETDTQVAREKIEEQSQMSREEFQHWMLSYQP